MAITAQDIVNFLIANPGMSDAQIAAAMDYYGVSPAQVAAATSVPVEQVQARYEAVAPAYTPPPAPVYTPPPAPARSPNAGQYGYANGAPVLDAGEAKRILSDEFYKPLDTAENNLGWGTNSKYLGRIVTGAGLYGIEGTKSEIGRLLDIGDKAKADFAAGKIRAIKDPETGQTFYQELTQTDEGPVYSNPAIGRFNTATGDESNAGDNFAKWQDTTAKLQGAARNLGIDTRGMTDRQVLDAVNKADTRVAVTGRTQFWDPSQAGMGGQEGPQHATVLYNEQNGKLVPAAPPQTFTFQDPNTSSGFFGDIAQGIMSILSVPPISAALGAYALGPMGPFAGVGETLGSFMPEIPPGITSLISIPSTTPREVASTITQSGLPAVALASTIPQAKPVIDVQAPQPVQPMAFTNEQIANYIAGIQASGGTNAEIAQAMDQFKVSPEQVAAATSIPAAAIQAEYNKVNPTGAYVTATPEQIFTSTLNQAVANRDAGITTLPAAQSTTTTAAPAATTTAPATQFTDEQTKNYIAAMQKEGAGIAQLAAEMDRLKVDPAQVSRATSVPLSQVQSMYNEVRPTGTYSTVAAPTTTPTTPATGIATLKNPLEQFTATTPGATDAQFAAWMKANNYTPAQVSSWSGIPESQIASRFAAATTPAITPKNPLEQFTLINPYPTDAQFAAWMTANKYTPAQVSSWSGIPESEISARFAAATKSPVTTGPTTADIAFDKAVQQALARPKYAPVQFTGKTGIGTIATPTTYQNLPLLAQQVTGAPAIIGLATPTQYAGVPAAPARPAANVSPEGFTAQDIVTDIVANQAAADNPGATPMKAGGLAGLANNLKSRGRNGDTELVHMTKDEVAGLHQLARSMGGHLTRNPHTGLYEANALSRAWRKVNRAGANVADALGLEGVYKGITGGIKSVGHNPYVQALLTTVAGATYGPAAAGALRTAFELDKGKKASEALREGVKTGAMVYAGQELLGAGPPGTQPPAPIDTIDLSSVPPVGPQSMITPDPNVISYTPDPNSIMGGGQPITQTALIDQPVVTDAGSAPTITSQVNEANKVYEAGRPFMERAADYAANLGTKALDYATEHPFPAAAYGTVAVGGVQSMLEQAKAKEEEARKKQQEEEDIRRKQGLAGDIVNRYPIRFAAAGGQLEVDDELGQDGFAAGGMPPRFLSGGGDGMSDSIPATIGDKQPARLADGEFVIPADVVSGLGNGSSKAGAKQLYAMMDRIRQARTGTTKQGREINPRRFMPA